MIQSGRKILQIHHSESPITTSPQLIEGWHLRRGFSEIGYHFVINSTGIFKCRSLTKDPAGIVGYNGGAIAVCFCGNFDRSDVPPQYVGILNSIDLMLFEAVNGYELVFHRDKTDKKTCPGLRFTKNLIRRLE